jgi:hypothetical protein
MSPAKLLMEVLGLAGLLPRPAGLSCYSEVRLQPSALAHSVNCITWGKEKICERDVAKLNATQKGTHSNQSTVAHRGWETFP